MKTGEVAWQHLVEEDTPLIPIIQKMTRYLFRDRYDNAISVLSALQPTLPTVITPQVLSPATEVLHQPVQTPTQPQTLPQASLPTVPQNLTAQPTPSFNALLWINVVLSGVLLGLGGYLFWQNQHNFRFSTSNNETIRGNAPSPSPSPNTPSPTITPNPSPNTPSPNPTTAPQPPDNRLTQDEAVEVVRQLISAKSVVFAPPYDEAVLRSLTTGEEFSRRNGSRTWLANNNAYYSYGSFEVRSPSRFSVRDNQAAIEVEIVEEPTLFINGVVDASQSGKTTGRYYGILRKENGVWKVASLNKVK